MLARLARLLPARRGGTARYALLVLVAVAIAVVVYMRWRKRRRRQEPFLAAVAASMKAGSAATWRCQDGYTWSGSKEKGKECRKGSKYEGTYYGAAGQMVCPQGWTQEGTKCKKGGKTIGMVKLSGQASALTGLVNYAKATSSSQTGEHWQCMKDGKSQGPIRINWGFKNGDATWACNEWKKKQCEGKCTAMWLNTTDPKDYAMVYYKDGRVHPVLNFPAENPSPIDGGYNDKKAGGIDKVYLPAGWSVCLKNRKRIDEIFPIAAEATAGFIGGNSDPYIPVPGWDSIDDIWGYADGRECPKAKTDPLKVFQGVMSGLTLGIVPPPT